MVYFIFYSFIGFVMESAYLSIMNKKIHLSGLLKGPFIPLYGFGATLLLHIYPFCLNNFDLFYFAVVLCTTLEYVTHLILEKELHIQIWNYKDFHQRFTHRICMFYSLLWGFLGLIFIHIIHPLVTYFISFIPYLILNTFAFISFMFILFQFFNQQYKKGLDHLNL